MGQVLFSLSCQYISRRLTAVSLSPPMLTLFLFQLEIIMPNYCNWMAIISHLSRDRMDRIARRAENSKLCEQILPYPKNVKEDLEMEDKFWKEWRRLEKEKWGNLTKEEIEKLKETYPHKQLWYDWRCLNWGSKWDLCYCNAYIWDITNDLTLQFETAWSPICKVFERLSKKYKCRVYYEWSEPWCWFSGRAERDNGEETYHEDFEDPYFWEWIECKVCGQVYDWRCEDDWSNYTLHICANCWEWTWHE